MTRRSFALLTAVSASRILGANDRVRVGLIGCGGRGRYVARFMREAPNVEFVAMCDVYRANAESGREWAGPQAKVYSDYRKLVEQKDLDAVMVSTPDHWHAIAAIEAIRAGKNVYVEKPIAYSIHEGRAIVNAARKSKALVMAGTQQRSATHFPEVAEMIQNGRLGKVRYVRVWNFTNIAPNGIGKEPDSAPPDGLDWDTYLGPAPKVPYNRKRFLATFRYFTDYAGGTITDYGTHRFDTVHQIMGVDAPHTVSASGGRFELNDAGDQPDTMQVTYEYPGFVMSYEMSNISAHGLGGRTAGMKYYNMRGELDRPHGMAFYGTNGAIFADRIGYEVYPDNDHIARASKITTDATSLHAKHFVACIRGQEKPKAEIEVGHRSTTVAHLGNIAYRSGKKLKWDAVKEEFPGEPDANKWLHRTPRAPWNV